MASEQLGDRPALQQPVCRCQQSCACNEEQSCSAMCLPSSGEAAPGSPLLQPLLGGGGGGGSGPVTPRSGTVTPRGAPVHAVLAIGGMQCSCCAVAVERALRYAFAGGHRLPRRRCAACMHACRPLPAPTCPPAMQLAARRAQRRSVSAGRDGACGAGPSCSSRHEAGAGCC